MLRFSKYRSKIFVSRKYHVKYQLKALVLIIVILKVISQIKVFKKGQSPRWRSQDLKCWRPRKTRVPKNTNVKYIKALALTVQKSIARLKFQTEIQHYRMKTKCPQIFDLRGIKRPLLTNLICNIWKWRRPKIVNLMLIPPLRHRTLGWVGDFLV